MWRKYRGADKDVSLSFAHRLCGATITSHSAAVHRANSTFTAWEDRTAECVETSSHDETDVTVTLKPASGAEQPAGHYRLVVLVNVSDGQRYERQSDLVIED